MFGKRFDGPTYGAVAMGIGGRRYVPAVSSLVNMTALNPADSALDGITALDEFDGRAITLDLQAGTAWIAPAGAGSVAGYAREER